LDGVPHEVDAGAEPHGARLPAAHHPRPRRHRAWHGDDRRDAADVHAFGSRLALDLVCPRNRKRGRVAMAEDLGERSEDATPKRLTEARAEGNVPKSN